MLEIKDAVGLFVLQERASEQVERVVRKAVSDHFAEGGDKNILRIALCAPGEARLVSAPISFFVRDVRGEDLHFRFLYAEQQDTVAVYSQVKSVPSIGGESVADLLRKEIDDFVQQGNRLKEGVCFEVFVSEGASVQVQETIVVGAAVAKLRLAKTLAAKDGIVPLRYEVVYVESVSFGEGD